MLLPQNAALMDYCALRPSLLLKYLSEHYVFSGWGKRDNPAFCHTKGLITNWINLHDLKIDKTDTEINRRMCYLQLNKHQLHNPNLGFPHRKNNQSQYFIPTVYIHTAVRGKKKNREGCFALPENKKVAHPRQLPTLGLVFLEIFGVLLGADLFWPWPETLHGSRISTWPCCVCVLLSIFFNAES